MRHCSSIKATTESPESLIPNNDARLLTAKKLVSLSKANEKVYGRKIILEARSKSFNSINNEVEEKYRK